MTKSRAIRIGLAAVVLTAAAVASASWMHVRQQAAQAAGEDWREVERLAGQVRLYQGRSSRVAEREQEATETTALIEATARKAGIAPERILQIVPQPPRPVGQGAYQEKPTQVLLGAVTLQQVATLLRELASQPQPLCAQALRLSTPQGAEEGANWNAEVTLTYLIYDPPGTER